MRFSFCYLILPLCLNLYLSTPSQAADTDPESRQQSFEADKEAALADFDATHAQACLKAFNARYPSHYHLSSALTLNEPLSLSAYDRLFWKGDGNTGRGLIFTGSVQDQSGAKAGNVICYYAMTNASLNFQNAYLMPLQMKDESMASLTTSSSKE